MPSPYQIPTALPFAGLAAAGNQFQANTPADLGRLYGSAQAAAVGLNAANYGNIATGYENVLAAQKAAQDQAHAGYGQLSSDVLGNLNLAGTTERQSIADQYARASGDLAQQSISSGLGNSTVQAALQRGLLLDRSKANNDVMERVGNLRAGYQSQIGQAGLGFDERAIGANTGLGLNQLGFQERVSAPYPQAQAYQAVASQMGATEQQNADREQMRQLAQQQSAASVRAGAAVPVTPGGGGGFFRDPNPQNAGGSGYSGTRVNYGVPARSAPPQRSSAPNFGPPAGTNLDAHPDPGMAAVLGGAGAAAFGAGYGQPAPYDPYSDLGMGPGYDPSVNAGAAAGGFGAYGPLSPQQATPSQDWQGQRGGGYGGYGEGGAIDAQLNQLSAATDFYFED